MTPRQALLLFLAAMPACGKRGDPLPPLSRVPQPVRELKLSQRGNELEVSFLAPRLTVGGLRLPVLDVELLRLEGDGDFNKSAVKESRKVAPGEAWSERVPLPKPGTKVRAAARATAEGQTSPLTPVASLTVQPVPAAPTELKATLLPDGVSLAWAGVIPPAPPSPSPSPAPSAAPGASASPGPSPRPSAGAYPPSPGPAVSPAPPLAAASSPAAPASSPPGGKADAAPLSTGAKTPGAPPPVGAKGPGAAPSPTPKPPARGFWIYRRAAMGGSTSTLPPEPLMTNTYEDKSVQPGQEWCYAVRAVAATEPLIESAPSDDACVSIKDITAPASPAGLLAIARESDVELSWSPSGEADLATYRVYRQAEGAEKPERIAEVPPTETSFRDPRPGKDTGHYYTVTAVDRAGNESAPSTSVEAHLP